MAIDDARRPEPAPAQEGPVPSDDGLTGSEFGRPPSPGEVGPDSGERELAGDVDGTDSAQAVPAQPGHPPHAPRGSSNQTTLPSH